MVLNCRVPKSELRMHKPQLVIVQLVTTESQAAAMFEGIDTVTGLFHRVCWMMTFDGERIKRLLVCVREGFRPEARLMPFRS